MNTERTHRWILAPGQIALSAALCLGASAVAQAESTTLFVDDDAPAGGNGQTWASAFRSLQDALAIARNGSATEIRVAQGVYRPDQGIGTIAGDQNAAFDLVNKVALRGGYAGIGAPDADARDVDAFITVLSGDLLGNDGANFVNYSDNAYRIVRATGLDLSTLIEGFTIIASQREAGEPLIGGGIYCSFGDLTLHDCRFERNLAYIGAAFAVRSGHVDIRRCVFEGNSADYAGGGYVQNNASVLLEDCAFNYNFTFAHDGGALRLEASHIIRRCAFSFNHSPNDAGAIYCVPGSGGLIENCQFTANHAGWMGGAVANSAGTFVRCRFENNTASAHGGAYAHVSPQSTQHARFISCDFIDNSTNSQTGGAASGGAAFIDCRFIGNRSGIGSSGPIAPGGAIRATAPTSLIANCTFVGNVATSAGGAIDVLAGSATTIIDCSFVNNQSGLAGRAVNGAAMICNSVFGQHAGGAPLANVAGVAHSLLPPGSPLPPGTGNIIGDARFVDPLGPDGIAGTEDDDLRLRADSPCIDAGDTTALPADQFDLDGDGDTAEPLPLDNAGNSRVLLAPATRDTGVPAPGTLAIVDMGAFEYRRPPDVFPTIGDGYVDVDDLISVILNWGPCEPKALDCTADTDGDAQVDIGDLIAVLLGWG